MRVQVGASQGLWASHWEEIRISSGGGNGPFGRRSFPLWEFSRVCHHSSRDGHMMTNRPNTLTAWHVGGGSQPHRIQVETSWLRTKPCDLSWTMTRNKKVTLANQVSADDVTFVLFRMSILVPMLSRHFCCLCLSSQCYSSRQWYIFLFGRWIGWFLLSLKSILLAVFSY